MTDEFGNLLKRGLKNSEEIVEACYELDELIADRHTAWGKAIEKGGLLIEQQKYSDAAHVLKEFAFASGTDRAKEGKRLFEKVATVASKELEKLLAGTRDQEVKTLDRKTRESLLAALDLFIEKWPKTPAAFSAQDLKVELAPIEEI
ncbi:MAG: hypothetical protein ABIK28_20535 [Planctomycetota bacterium]